MNLGRNSICFGKKKVLSQQIISIGGRRVIVLEAYDHLKNIIKYN